MASQALSNLNFYVPLSTKRYCSTSPVMGFGFKNKNSNYNCRIVKAMQAESRENLDHFQRANGKHQQSNYQSTQPKKRVAPSAPVGLWDRFPTARTVQQMMETMESLMDDPFRYTTRWPSPMSSETSGYSRGRTPWEIKEGENEYKMRFDMPGMTKQDVRVWVEDKMLVVKAEKAPKDNEDWSAKSYGRFMSESLAWEKWSTFSHNRYLEEAEQFSKPGSVAQKKAYFEAHYRKRAAMKAAALVEQASTSSVNTVPEAEPARDSHNDSSAEPESITGNGDVDMDEQLEKDAAEAELNYLANLMPSNSDVSSDKLKKENVQNNAVVGEQNGEIETAIPSEISSNLGNDECRETTPEENMLIEDAAGEDNGSSSSKTADQSKASKIQRSSFTKANSTQLKAGGSNDTSSKKTLGDLLNKKKLTPKSMHMSINFTSNSGNTSKDHLRKPKGVSAAVQNPIKKSVHGAPNLRQSIAQESTENRANSVVNKSVSGRVLRSISSETSKTSGSKSRLSIISSPFSFRSEERAAKRKEFFQKLEEKNAKQKETMHQKEKAEHGLAKLRQSFRIKLSEDPCHGLQSPRNQIKKIPPTRPRSPKLGRKRAPSTIPETNTQLTQRPTVNSESSKNVVVKSSLSMARSVTRLPKKKEHENASPNIQR